jgi:opacity protein-like surface antigen
MAERSSLVLAAVALAPLVTWSSGCTSVAPRYDASRYETVESPPAHTYEPTSASTLESELAALKDAPPGPPQIIVETVRASDLVAKPGSYFTASVIGTELGGDLNGSNRLFGPSTILLPDVDSGAGFEIGVGFRTIGDAFEITYDNVEHGGSFQGMSLDSHEQLVNLDWKHFFLIDKHIQPYTLLGMNIPWYEIENGARKGPLVGDATLYGIGFNAGLGAAYYVTPQLAINFQGVFRFIDFFDVDALDHSGSINGSVDSEGWKMNLGFAYTF